ATKTSAAAMMVKRRVRITGNGLKRQDVNRRRSVGNPRKARNDGLFGQTDVGAFTVTVRIRAQGQINSFGCIYEIEVCCSTEPASADRYMSALVAAATGHIEFINDYVTIDIDNLDLHRQ